MKKVISLLVGIVLSLNVLSQCAGFIDFDFNPQYPPNSTYAPGTEVTFCCTMTGWNGNDQGVNWFEGFGLTLGSGWESVTPLQAPNDADTDSGDWIWVTSVTSESTGFTAGPGYFFEGPSGPTDGDPGNDYGDLCSNGDCVWEFCVVLVVSDNVGESLSIGVTPYADGTMGNWINWECFDGPTIWNGTVGCSVYGCTNQIACNYDPNANCDDGNCVLPGCIDLTACNYDPTAGCDDGSCTYEGCIDPLACNFNPTAGCDDGTCNYFSMGSITPCPDTVCTGLEVNYSVTGNQSSIYDWHISGGGLVTTDQTNDCEIIWGNTPGTYTISVHEVTPQGCEGQDETCDVVVVMPEITFDTTNYDICLNNTVELEALPADGNWVDDFVNGNIFIGQTSGIFTPDYYAFIYGCDVIDNVTINVRAKSEAPNIIYSLEFIDFCTDNYNQIYTAESDNNVRYQWFIDDVPQIDTDNQLTVEWADTTRTYIIKVIGYDELGCESEPKLISVKTQTCQRFFAPNSFTPNGDGINDVFKISGLSVYQPSLRIFNRWGVEIYSSSNLWWTGDTGGGYYPNTDTYTWTVSYLDKDGFHKEEKGHVTLIR
jgi:gliding motility-associated-like protein